MISHLALHFLAPLLIAFLFFRENWKLSYLVMMATMLVDLAVLFGNDGNHAG